MTTSPSSRLLEIGFNLSTQVLGAEDMNSDSGPGFSMLPDDLFVQATAYLTLDGRLVQGLTPTPLDTFSVLAQGDTEGAFLPYTCGCGVSECIGIFEDALLRVDGEELHWILPADPFTKWLGPEYATVTGKTVVLRFARTQYLNALASLLAQLQECERASGMASYPNTGLPFAGSVERAGQLVERIAHVRRFQLERALSRSRRLKTFAPVDGTEVSFGLHGQKFTLRSDSFAHSVVYAQNPDYPSQDAYDAHLADVVVEMAASPEKLRDLLLALPWETVYDDFNMVAWDIPQETLRASWLSDGPGEVQLVPETLER